MTRSSYRMSTATAQKRAAPKPDLLKAREAALGLSTQELLPEVDVAAGIFDIDGDLSEQIPAKVAPVRFSLITALAASRMRIEQARAQGDWDRPAAYVPYLMETALAWVTPAYKAGHYYLAFSEPVAPYDPIDEIQLYEDWTYLRIILRKLLLDPDGDIWQPWG
jgi:hypothetical protein